MEELSKLLGLIQEDKKEEARGYISAVEAKVKSLGDEITESARKASIAESKFNEATKTRDKLKTKILSLAGNLGIATAEKTLEEVVQAVIEKKGKTEETDALNAKTREIEQLETKLTELNQALEAEKATAQDNITKAILEKDLALILPKYNAVEDAIPYLINDIMNLPKKFEDGGVVFLDESGVPLRNKAGTEKATIESIVAEKKEAEKEAGKSFFFDNSVDDVGAKSGHGAKQNEGGLNKTPKF